MQRVKIYIDSVELTPDNREALLGAVEYKGLFTKTMTPMEDALSTLQYALSDILTADGENTVITTVLGHHVRFVFVNYPDTYSKTYSLRNGERITFEFRHPYGTEKEVAMAEAARDKVTRDLIARIEAEHRAATRSEVEDIIRAQMDAELRAIYFAENASTILQSFYSIGVQDYCNEHPEVYHLSDENPVEAYGREVDAMQKRMADELEEASNYHSIDELSKRLGVSRATLYRKANRLAERLGHAPTMTEVMEEHLRTAGKHGRPKKY